MHAFMMLAERRRRLREAQESGQRQVEMRQRRTNDELFKQVRREGRGRGRKIEIARRGEREKGEKERREDVKWQCTVSAVIEVGWCCLVDVCRLQMMDVHTASVDSFLEDVILHSVKRTADEQSREEIRRQADTINGLAHKFQHT